jgi:hypothetical protein
MTTRRWRIQRVIKDGKVIWEKEVQEIIEPSIRMEIEIPRIDIDEFFEDVFGKSLEVKEELALPEKKGFFEKLKNILRR